MMLLKPDVLSLVARDDTRTLIRATRHWSAAIRGEAAAALGALRTASAVPELIRLLKDHQPEVRESAARALGDIGPPEAAGPLVEALRALKGQRNDRPGAKEYEFEAIAEALGRLNSPEGVAAVVESGTVRFHEGFFSLSRPHVGGLCLSGGTEARAALIQILAEHYLYETYSLIGVVEALDHLREPRATSALIEILNDFVDLLKKPWLPSLDPASSTDRNRKALALSAVRALGRLETRRAEPVLIDLLLHLPMHHAGDGDGGDSLLLDRALSDTQDAILAIRGEKIPAEFNYGRASLRLHDYRSRRQKMDVEFGGEKRWIPESGAVPAEPRLPRSGYEMPG